MPNTIVSSCIHNTLIIMVVYMILLGVLHIVLSALAYTKSYSLITAAPESSIAPDEHVVPQQSNGNEQSLSESGAQYPKVSEQERILNCLHTVATLGLRHDLNETEKAQLQDALDYMSHLKGFEVTDALNSDFKGEALMDALHAVGIHASLTGLESPDSIGLSSLGVSILLSSMQKMLGADRRNDLSVLMTMYNEMTPRQRGSDELVSACLGCGRNRLYKAAKDIQANGLRLECKHANAEGAGRPNVYESFSEDFESLCMDAGLNEDEMIARHLQAQAREAVALVDEQAASSDADSGTEQIKETDHTEEAAETSGNFRKVGVEEIKLISNDSDLSYQQRFEAVSEMTQSTLEEIDSLLHDVRFGNTEGLKILRSLVTDTLDKISANFKDVLAEESALSPETAGQADVQDSVNGTNTTSNANSTSDVIFPDCDLFRQVNKRNMVRAALKEVEVICLTVKECAHQREHDPQSTYTTIRNIEASLHPKAIRINLAQKWLHYETAQSILNKLKKKLANRPEPVVEEQETVVVSTETPVETPVVVIAETPTEMNADDTESTAKNVPQEPDPSVITSNANAVSMDLDEMIHRFEGAIDAESTQNDRITAALEYLYDLRTLFSDALQHKQNDENSSVLAALSTIIEVLRHDLKKWIWIWNQQGTILAAAKQTSYMILSKRFDRAIHARYKELSLACAMNLNADEMVNTSPDTPDALTPATPSDADQNASKNEIGEETRHEAEKAVQSVMDLFELLKKLLLEGAEKKVVRKNSVEDHIAEAGDYLNTAMETFQKHAEEMFEANDTDRLSLFKSVISGLSSFLFNQLDRWFKQPDGEYVILYSAAKNASTSLLNKSNRKSVDKLWATYAAEVKYLSTRPVYGEIPENFVPMGKSESLVHRAQMNRERIAETRMELIRKFWDAGKDPLDIRVWIEHIVEDDCKNSYGDPSGRGKYCRLSRDELQCAFYYLTGFSCCSKTLWKILTSDMGYSRRQCAKLDQFGKEHELAHVQYENITKFMNEADPKEVLILSIDTKALIALGKFKPDNGRLLCSPGSGAFRTYHHDFVIQLRDIYFDGTDLVDESRLDERAVLHPVGVYCPSDNTGYVSLVLGKDTAESMHNLLRVVIAKKKEQIPTLKRVLIIADGGGSNMSNGIVWPNELLYLADEVQMPIQVAHTAPGCSKHNIIERALFSVISKHWRGKPHWDIEHVAQYISETTTNPGSGNPLKVECWFDRKRYLTNAEKKTAGEDVLTRAEFNQKAKGRIVHLFAEGNDLYKWNYTVLPKSMMQDETGAVA